jgi:hypothetical protein
MANSAPFQIIAGPAAVFFAPVGTAFAALDADPTGSGWTYVGQTEGGVKVKHSQTIVKLYTDQVTVPVKQLRSEEGLEITANMAELTLENYAIALNDATVTAGAGDKSIPLYRGGSQVNTHALLVRGPHLSPYGDLNLQYEVPIVYADGDPEVDYTKATMTVLALTWTAVAADLSFDAAREDVFGVLRAGTP